MEHSKETIAMLIDADNSPSDKIDLILAEMAKYGVVNIRRAYGNWKSHSLKGWEDKLHDYAIRPIQQFDYTKGKNATDMAMTIDAMDLLYSKKLDAFCIVSSDSDFTPLVMRILSEGLNVYGFGQKSTPSPFVNACSTFLYLDSFGEQEKTKSDNGRRKSSHEMKGDSKLMTLIRVAVDSAQEEDGWSNLAKIGKNISNQASFDPRNYGYKRLSDLIRSIDLFEIEFRNNNSELYIRDKRKRVPVPVSSEAAAAVPPTAPVREIQSAEHFSLKPTSSSAAPSRHSQPEPVVSKPAVADPFIPEPVTPEPAVVSPSASETKPDSDSPVPEPFRSKPLVTEPVDLSSPVREPDVARPMLQESDEQSHVAPVPQQGVPTDDSLLSPPQDSSFGKPAPSEPLPVMKSRSRAARTRKKSSVVPSSQVSLPEPESPTISSEKAIPESIAPTMPAEPATETVGQAPVAESRPKRRPRRPARKKSESSDE